MDLPAQPTFSVRSLQHLPFGDFMKRIAALILLGVLSAAASLPANAQRENRSIGENSREARKAAKHQQKASKKLAKQQRKAAKKYQKQQRKAAKQQQRRHK
jgi:hypothetical protein